MPKKRRNLLIFSIILFPILLGVGLFFYIPYLKTVSLLHPQRNTIKLFPANTQYENVSFTTSDDIAIKGWYIPAKNGKVILFVHGLGGDRTEFLSEASVVTAKGYGALMIDLRAHGESGGNVSTLGYTERRDIRAAVDFIRAKAGLNTPVAIFGHSMGAATSLMAAAEIPEISAVLVESPFTTVENNISTVVSTLTGLPPGPFAGLIIFYGQQETGVNISDVRPIDVLSRISPRPILFIHGDKDETIPVNNSYQLYAAAGEPKQLYILPGVGHGGFVQADPQKFRKTVLEFLEKYLK